MRARSSASVSYTHLLLAPDVDIVFAAVPAAVEKLGAPQKTIVVGNPVRPEVFTLSLIHI